jgi:hypothetical protein
VQVRNAEGPRNVAALLTIGSEPDEAIRADGKYSIVLISRHEDTFGASPKAAGNGEAKPRRFQTAHLHNHCEKGSGDTTVSGRPEFCEPLKCVGKSATQLGLNSVNPGKQSQTLAEGHLEFEKTLAEISAMFVNVAPGKVDDRIREAQKIICETLGLDCSTLFQVCPGGKDVIVTHSWAAKGFELTPSVSANDLPWCSKVVLSGQRLVFGRIDDLPEEAAKDKEMFRRFGPKSNVSFPLLATFRRKIARFE